MALAQLIDGKAIAQTLRGDVAQAATQLIEKHGIRPALAVIQVGADPASQSYVKSKTKQAAAASIVAIDRHLDESVSEDELLALIAEFNNDPAVHGILVQLPLPAHISSDKVLHAIDPKKDVDGFHPVSIGLLASGQMDKTFVPCTPLGCQIMLERQLGNLSGKDAVIIGRSNIVGKPMALLLLNANCTVTVVHSRTTRIEDHCRRADILVAAVGRPAMVKANWIKPGASVIDVGINRITDASGKSRLVGDVDFDAAAQVAGAITPVPGGVGPMTIACLLANTIRAACLANDLPAPRWSVS